MEESKETAAKRPLESSLPWNSNREEAAAEAEGGYLNSIPKRPCTGRDGDSFDEFFALLKRIEATQRYCQKATAKGVQERKTVASKASWHPSFELEDFSSRRNGTRDVESSLSAVKAGDGKVEEKEIVRHANGNNLKPEASRNPDLEGLDLNSLPAELPLFQ